MVEADKASKCPAHNKGVFNTVEIDSSPMNGFPGQKCPFMGNRIAGVEGTGTQLEDLFPERLRVELLGLPNANSNPYGKDFNYAEAFKKLDYKALKADLHKFMTDSKSFWPADYGHYGPLVIRTVWHGAGTYRISDGRGGAGHGMQRFLPISSWEDNGNTDKLRRLLWPIKQKYGDNISWADLLVLTGNVALESMGLKTQGFAGGRTDGWEDDVGTHWMNTTETFGRKDRWEGDQFNGQGDLANPYGASEAQLIYVNPEGPGTNPDPAGSAIEIRNTFRRMAMTDEETVALIAGGHTFGKSHGAVPADNVGPPPGVAGIESQGLGWFNSKGSGKAEFTTTNGCEGSWTGHPTRLDMGFVINLMDNEWDLAKSPAGNWQWHPRKVTESLKTPDAHLKGVDHPVMMFTSDLALKVDPEFHKVMKKFRESPPEVFYEAFSRAWYKLTHRDLGPKVRYIGPEVPEKDEIWQDPIPARDFDLIDDSDIASLKEQIRSSSSDLLPYARAAWAAASTFRGTDLRGGVNGARIRLAPQKDWEVNRPEELNKVISELESLQQKFNSKQSGKKRVSLADLIVLAGGTAVEDAAKKSGVPVTVPFTPGRTDTTDELTDATSFEWLRPVMDGFRNFESAGNYSVGAEHFLLDRAKLLNLTGPQLAALIGGMRSMGLNWDDSELGVFTDRKGTLSNDFFVNLLDLSTKWRAIDDKKQRFEGVDLDTGKHKWYATRVDLAFGDQSQLRAYSEVYGSSTGNERLVKDFVSAWQHVMELDRFDLHP